MLRPLIALMAAILPATALAAAPETAALPAGHYVLDKRHSSVTVRVKHLGVSWYVARFDDMDADFTFDPAHPEATKVSATVATTSFDDGSPDSRKFANDFLDAANNPVARFVSTGATPVPDGRSGTLTGDLTLRGVTRPVTWQVSLNGVGHQLLSSGVIAGFSAHTVVKRSAFGSNYVRAFVGDDVDIDVEGEFARK